MTRTARALGCLLSICAVGCEMDDGKMSSESVQASLSGRRCDDEAKRACDDARHAHKSDEEADRVYGHRYIDCSIETYQCSCTAEKDCLEVARRKLGRVCDRDRHARGRISQDWLAEVAHCRKVCTGERFDLETCANEVPVRDDLVGKKREIAFQVDIGSYCGAPGLSSCDNELIARANVDYSAAALQVVGSRMTPAQYLALSRDRTRKLRAAEEDGRRAALLCGSRDSDGDWVVDSRDRCPNTPDLTATDDNGCPITALPLGPAPEDVARVLSRTYGAINPKCKDAPVPERVPAGAFYWPDFLDRGTYILTGAVTNQPSGCPVWYEFEIEELSGSQRGYRYLTAFLDREASNDLVQLGRPVPAGFIQFNPRPDDARADRARLATTGPRAGIQYRVRAVNAVGVRGLWSDYKISNKADCIALGFKCRDH